MDGDLIPLPLNTIRIAYTELCRSITIALRTQIGDVVRLDTSKQDCLRFFATTEQVCRHCQTVDLYN
jgi:hypothetical protein